jgi:hypothetical protein
MTKYILVSAISLTLLGNAMAASAAPPAKSGNKFSDAMHSVGRGIMWGPKKIGEGLKSAGEKTKAMFHKK